MRKIIIATAIALMSTAAHAKSFHHHFRARHHASHHHHHHQLASEQSSLPQSGGNNVAAARARGLPWCGAYMADLFGKVGARARELWLARNWAREGHATVAHVGAVVVWAHHVGKIVGREHGQWVVLSGNDGHAIRARARSIAGAIAFRDI